MTWRDRMPAFSRADVVAAAGIVVLTLVAWAPILAVPGARWWDDWQPFTGFYASLGMPWLGPVAAALMSAGPAAFTVLGLVATVAAGWALLRITSRGLGLSRFEGWVLAALVTVLPLNAAKVALSILWPYTLSLAVFLIAWAILVGGDRPVRPGHVRAAVATVLFVLSFTTASLLVFIALPVAHLAFLAVDRHAPRLAQLARLVARYPYLVLAPFAYQAAKVLFFPISGRWADYNQFVAWSLPLPRAALAVVLAGAVLVITGAVLLAAWWRDPEDPRRPGMRWIPAALLAAAAVVAGAGIWAARGHGVAAPALIAVLVIAAAAVLFARAEAVILVAVGLAALALAVAPYALVSKLPTFADFQSRHQLLMPIGVALLVVATLRILGPRLRRPAAAAVIAAATLVALSLTLDLVADAHKQQQITAAFAVDPAIASARTILLDDQAEAWNAEGRTQGYPEISGWVTEAVGGSQRLGVALGRLDRLQEGRYDLGIAEMFPDWERDGPVVVATVTARPGAAWWDLVLGRPAVDVEVREVAPSLADLADGPVGARG